MKIDRSKPGFTVADLERALPRTKQGETLLETPRGDIYYKANSMKFVNDRGTRMTEEEKMSFSGAAMVLLFDDSTEAKKKKVLTAVLRAMFS